MTSEIAQAAGGTVDALFRRAFRVFAARTAVASEDAHWTYARLGERSRRLANGLAALGFRRGDRLAVLCETRPEYVECYAALASLGVTLVALNVRLHPDELRYCLEKARPTGLVVSGPLAPIAAQLRPALNVVRHWFALDGADGFESYESLLARSTDDERPVVAEPEDIHNILFTSGTTGRPKGAMVSQRAAAVRGLRLAQWFRLSESDGFVGWLPLFHCGGDESLYATLLTGGTYATLRKADTETMFRMISRDRLTWTLLLPGVITNFLNHPKRADYDLTSFRLAGGYANMMPHVVEELCRQCRCEFFDAFGQTEVSYVLAHVFVKPGETPTLRKWPTPLLDVRIVDDALNEQPVGVPGECVVRGPSVMSGYLDDDAANAEVFRGGWLHTGDVLVRHEDGSLTYVDRRKYLIKTGGENVYPAEVEAVLAGHPSVQEVCAFGVPDPHWGETIKVVVVKRPGCEVTPAELVALCRAELASFKRPRYVQFVRAEDLPRSTTGKLQRHELARLALSDDQKV